METVFITVIPGKVLPAGVPFRSDVDGSYFKELSSAIYCGSINATGRYFFVEERYYIKKDDGFWKLGNIKNLHHFNKARGVVELMNYNKN